MATSNIPYFDPTNTRLICAQLDRNDLFNCMLVCKSWNKELNSDAFQTLFVETFGIKTNSFIQAKIAFKAIFKAPINERKYINIFVQAFILFGENKRMPPYRLSLNHDSNAALAQVSYIQPPFCERDWYICEFTEDAEGEQIISPASNDDILLLKSRTT